jgi:hypothetical protein
MEGAEKGEYDDERVRKAGEREAQRKRGHEAPLGERMGPRKESILAVSVVLRRC